MTTSIVRTPTSNLPSEVAEQPPPAEMLEPDRVIDLPAGSIALDVAVGTETVVVLGTNWYDDDPQIWSTAMDEPAAVADLLRRDASDTARQSGLGGASAAYFDERYFVFLAGDPNAADLIPTVLVSRDAIEWAPLDMSVRVGASLLQPSARLTPDSPPHAGGSAVLAVITRSQRIIATGWATVNGVVEPVVWESFDGQTWTLSLVAPGADCPEYGSNIAASQDVVVVERQGCTYYGAGASWSDGGPFDATPEYLTGDAQTLTSLIGMIGAEAVAIQSDLHGTAHLRLGTADGWSDGADLPYPLPNSRWFGVATDAVGVVIWTDYGDDSIEIAAHRLVDDAWHQLGIVGQQIIGTDGAAIVVAEEGALRFYSLD